MKDINYEIIGKGYPIVLLHGNGEDLHIFDEFVQNMKNEYQLICIDSRYHGKSIKKGELSYQQMCKDVIHVIDELDIEQYDVVGFSDGGIISILLSLKDQRLKHMVIIGANVRVSGLKWICRLNDWLMLFCLIPFSLYHKKMRIKWRLIKMMETMKEIPKEDLNQIMVPTLILAGEYDLIKQEETEYIHKNIKYSVMKIIENGSHFILRDDFQKTMKEVNMFLSACHQKEEL